MLINEKADGIPSAFFCSVGYPFAATGGRIIATMAKLLHQKGSGKGSISVCAAGGLGITALLEK